MRDVFRAGRVFGDHGRAYDHAVSVFWVGQQVSQILPDGLVGNSGMPPMRFCVVYLEVGIDGIQVWESAFQRG